MANDNNGGASNANAAAEGSVNASSPPISLSLAPPPASGASNVPRAIGIPSALSPVREERAVDNSLSSFSPIFPQQARGPAQVAPVGNDSMALFMNMFSVFADKMTSAVSNSVASQMAVVAGGLAEVVRGELRAVVRSKDVPSEERERTHRDWARGRTAAAVSDLECQDDGVNEKNDDDEKRVIAKDRKSVV